ncbi:uncharacterized protein JCM15063_004924 [Sporobolomyces koalae]|uniref:uncharacterized protein n=1 Tax=Sporobolomyces koalae TaxID=500713 RepID=UPI0031792E80
MSSSTPEPEYPARPSPSSLYFRPPSRDTSPDFSSGPDDDDDQHRPSANRMSPGTAMARPEARTEAETRLRTRLRKASNPGISIEQLESIKAVYAYSATATTATDKWILKGWPEDEQDQVLYPPNDHVNDKVYIWSVLQSQSTLYDAPRS